MTLSEHAKGLVSRLYERPSTYKRLLGKSGWNVGVLKQLLDLAEPAAIPYVAPVLVTGTKSEIIFAARAIEAMLSRTAPEELAWLDAHMRSSWFFRYPCHGRWRKLKPSEVAKCVGPGERGRSLLRLSSFHASGFVREEATRRLALIQDGSELPYLLLRLNDWVSEVRKLAEKAVISRIQTNYVDHLINNLVLVDRLKRVRRVNHSDVVERITRLLSEPASRPSLLAGMNSSSRIIRRSCFSLLAADESADKAGFLLLALEGKDPVIRLWATRLIGSALTQSQLAEVLFRLLHDRFAPIRCEALGMWVKALPDNAREQLLTALLDSSRSVREEARFHLRRVSDLDLAQFYRDIVMVNSSKRLAIALSGLAETGIAADASLVSPYLSHPVSKVRRTSIECLIKLGGEQHVRVVLGMILDRSPSVSAQARRALKPYVRAIGAGPLWTLFEEAVTAHGQMNLLSLIAALSKWDSISYFILGLSHEDPAVSELAASLVDRWYATYCRNQLVPSRDQLAQLEAALADSREELADGVRFLVNSFK
jgi:HEAT repeat protein